MKILIGTRQHKDDITRMALDFFHASPYRDFGVDVTRVEELIDIFLNSPPKERITFVLLDETTPVGVLAAVVETNIFNYDKFAGELIWWIDPDYRNGSNAEDMRKAFEYWAKAMDCQIATLVDVMGNLDAYYRRKKYIRGETNYIKGIMPIRLTPTPTCAR